MRYTTIGKAFKLKSGVGLSAKKMMSGDYPVFGGNGINGTHNEYMFKDQKIVIGRVGAYCGNVHKTEPKSWITDNALFIHEFFEEYDTNYLVMLLRNLNLNKYASQSGQPLISAGRLKDVQIPLPPLDQQKKIAAILDAADAYRQKTKALIEKYDELTQSLFLDMFGDPVTNPKGWEKKSFMDIFAVTTGKLDSNQAKSNGQYPFFTCAKETSRIDRFSFDQEALLLAGNNAAGVYDVKYFKGKFDAYQRTYVLTLNDGNNFQFFRYHLEQKLQELQKVSIGSGTKYLTIKILERVILLCPDKEYQNIFASRVQAIEEQKAQAKTSLAGAEDLFNSLLQRAFKGELTA